MNKKLIAVAVAGLFAAPAAFAQVTISGKVHVSFGQYHVANRIIGGTGGSSETQVRDESSAIVFSMREDLGGGLAAIGRFDLRFAAPDGGVGGNSGVSFVGLTSPQWGTLSFGKFDLHYGNHASFTGTHAGLQTNPTALFDMAAAGSAAAGGSIGSQTRTNNAIRYGSPKFGDMFELNVAYSTNPTPASNTQAVTIACNAAGTICTPSVTIANQAENDLRSTVRKGSAWNVNPKLYGRNWEAGYSYWTAMPDVGLSAINTAAAAPFVATPTGVLKQRGDSVYGWYKWDGFRAGLAWNKSRVDTTAVTNVGTAAAPILVAGATAQTSRRTVWGVPVSYNWGKHTVYGDYYAAGPDSAAGFAGLNTKARFVGLTYAYDLSKRTSAAVHYTKITNQANAAFNLFQGSAGLAAGEDPRSVQVSFAHRF